MFKLLALLFFCFNTAFSQTFFEDEKQDERIVACQKGFSASSQSKEKLYIFVNPDAFHQFKFFFFALPFMVKKEAVLRPSIYRSFVKISSPLENSMDSQSKQKICELFSFEENALRNITILANRLLRVLNIQSTFPVQFSSIYAYDRKIILETMNSFFRIIHSINPNERRDSEWKSRVFINAFAQVWGNLHAQDDNVWLNFELHRSLSLILGIQSDSYKKIFRKSYPHLTEWLKYFAPNHPKNLSATIFTLSLMHALAPKTRTPFAQQVILAAPQQGGPQSYLVDQSSEEVTITLIAPTPSRSFSQYRKTLGGMASKKTSFNNLCDFSK